MDNVFSIQPSTNMMDVLGHGGYSLNSAIADIIDNSIAAKATEITLFFNIDNKNPYLYILDNGNGMSLEELKNAVVIGFKPIDDYRGEDDLGRYSTGLKSATRSIADNVIIASNIDNKSSIVQLDYKYIIDNGKWEAFLLNDFSLSRIIGNHGTMVYCDRLLKGINISNLQLLADLEKYISHYFGKFLLSNSIRIYIQTNNSNKRLIQGWNPFKLLHNDSVRTILETTKDFKGSNITAKVYIFPTFNNLDAEDQEYMNGYGLNEQAGFYVYRNKRLITEGGWLDLPGLKIDDKYRYCRIELNIPSKLDEEFNVNFSKTKVTVPDDLKIWLISVAKKGRNASVSSYNYMNKQPVSKVKKGKQESVWSVKKTNHGTNVVLNENHSLILEYCKDMKPNDKKKLFNLINKSLPVTTIQGQEVLSNKLSSNEVLEMLKEEYLVLLPKLGKEKTIDKLKNMEPFRSDEIAFAQFLVDLMEMEE